MLREGHKAKGILDSPELNFTVIATCCDQRAIRAVRQRIQVEEMTLLLQNIGLTLPLPHEELSLLL